MQPYDYVIVGAGLFGATFAYLAAQQGKKCLVLDKRDHIAGNAYTEQIDGIAVHRYGAHIFHTADKALWDWVNRFAHFVPYVHKVQAVHDGKRYSLPFSMYTFAQMWGVQTPQEAREKIQSQCLAVEHPANLEEWALHLVGKDIYEALIRNYTAKQWGRDCRDLPAAILKRIPLRFAYDDNYFDDAYQGIPQEGYTAMVEAMLQGTDVLLGVDYHDYARTAPAPRCKTLYTGSIDRFFDYRLGALAYRSIRLETEVLPQEFFQDRAVVNYPDLEVPYTRIIEHKHFLGTQSAHTVVSREYSAEWQVGAEPYYPINDETNDRLYAAYLALAEERPDVIFGGRLGAYRYYDMSTAIQAAMKTADEELHR